ncbi:AMP-binding protein [Ectothiorhodospiraceae bacterium WFHF3C12]|nr:AMP-binding protein [Ectothiorhodospiraceae bacterium WFHF3C12]
MNVANLLVRSGRSFPDRPAVALGAEPVMDYAGLAARVGRLAGGLRETLGCQAGDRVALIMKNSPAYIEALFAAWYAGLIAVPVNAKLAPGELAFILRHSGSRVCLITDDLADSVGAAVAEAPVVEQVIPAGGHAYEDLFAGEPMPPAPAEPDDVAWLFYTSGTTGTPKGAMLTHRNLAMMSAGYFTDVDAIAANDAIVHAAPMSHGSGLYILPHVAAAAVQVVPSSGGFDPGEVLDLIGRYPGTSLFAAPTMVRRLTDEARRSGADTANLKTIVYGGGPMYLEDLKDAMATFGPRLAQIYGQGESPMTITAMSRRLHHEALRDGNEERLASVGLPQALVQVRVADEHGNPVPDGTVGEVLVRGDVVMKGYWNAPEATAATLRDGWLHTGDTGCFDAAGYLTLKDRTKDLIISGGTNIYPREIEEVLLLHEGVAEVAVVGRRSREWGEEVIAFVVPSGASAPAPQTLDAFCLERIARFKRPREYRFLDTLPKNAYGKVVKSELRSSLEEEDLR